MASDRLTSSFQLASPTLVDRFGQHLSRRQILRFVGDIRGKRIADLGCGFRAVIVAPWLGEVKEAHLIDLRLHPDLIRHPCVLATEGRLPDAVKGIPSEHLDVVIANSVLEHLWQPEKLLSEIHRILAPNGIALVNVPSWRGKRFLEFSAFRLALSPAEEMDDHKRYYDVRDLWPLLVQAGFRPSKINCFHHKFGLNTFGVMKK